MIALKLIIQSLAGVSAVAGLCASSTLLISSKNKEKNDYFLMISNTVANAQKEDTKYKCKTNANIEDDSCSLFSLKFNDQKKSIDFEELKAFVKGSGKETKAITKTKAQDIKTMKFFILKTSVTFGSFIKLDWTTQINLLNKDSNQDIAGFSVYAKITEDQALGEVNNLIAKVTKVNANNVEQTSQQMTHMCKLNGSDKKIQSHMTPIKKTSEIQTYKDLIFSALTEENTVAAKENDYFLINFMFIVGENKNVEISSVKNATIACDIENLNGPGQAKSVNTQISLSIEAPIFIIQNQPNTSVVFLK